ncbi:MAG: Hsp70 family protein [Polyangia bacterium]|jgi:molecular chaperone DnaK|nr:Hsp70 family protein [Polyangia bacterium]
MPDPVLGIDLGTSNSVVATIREGEPEVLRDSEGRTLVPSVVSFHPSGTVLVGSEAVGRLLVDPEHTVFSAKRLIGRPFSDLVAQDFLSKVPFHAQAGDNQEILIQARDERMTVPELSAFLLHHIKVIAERGLRKMARKAVVTVPANFNDAQRAATLQAGETAGLEVLRILNEPTAAALAYGYGMDFDRRVIIYDFGGGTFDVTILDIHGDLFEVRATAGDTYLGGNDMDSRLLDVLAQKLLEEQGYDPREDPMVLGKLRQAAENAKCELSYNPRAKIRLDELAYGPKGKAISLHHEVDRGFFEKLVEDLVDRTFVICDEAFNLAGLQANQVDEVVLVGGTTRMPLVRQSVQSYFARAPMASIDPDQVVAMGAALQAASLMGIEARVPSGAKPAERDATTSPPPAPPEPAQAAETKPPTRQAPPPLPGARSGPLGGAGSPEPRGQGVVPTPIAAPALGQLPAVPPGAAHSGSPGVELELVGPGPAVQEQPKPPAQVRRPLLLDVTPLSLGVATVGGYSQVIIPRNSPVPVEASRTYVTSEDDQTQVIIRICQGESRRFEENTVLGELLLEGLPAAPRGDVSIRVTFEIDTSGILKASASDERTGQVQRATIQLRGRKEGARRDATISGEEGAYRLSRSSGEAART